MSRIRTIKPEFPQSETIGHLSREARLLFILIWTIADDEGRARAASRLLASLLYPYDDDAPQLIDGWLGDLEREACIRLYDVEGARYLEIINWRKHQKIDRPSQSRLPAYDDATRVIAKPREPSRALDADLGPRTLDQDLGPGSGNKDHDSSLRSESAPAVPLTDDALNPPTVYTDATHELWTEGVSILKSLSVKERESRSMIGKWLKETGDDRAAVLDLIKRARAEKRTHDPIPWITAAIKPPSTKTRDKIDPIMEGLQRRHDHLFGKAA